MIIPHLTMVLYPCSLLLLSRWEFSLSAKHVNRSGVVTTIITATVSNLVSRVVSQSQPTSAGMNNTGRSVNVAERVGHKWLWKWHSTETTLFLMITWIGYFIGAASSGAALFFYRVLLQLQYHLR